MTKKMNPEIKAQWVAALRSGKYEQGKGNLKKITSSVASVFYATFIKKHIPKINGMPVTLISIDGEKRKYR